MRLLGQELVEVTAPPCGVFALPKLQCLGCIEHELNAIPDAVRSNRDLAPDRRQHIQDIVRVDLGYPKSAYDRVDMLREGILPLLVMLLGPARGMRAYVPFCRRPKCVARCGSRCFGSFGLRAFSGWINAACDIESVLVSLQSCVSEAQGRKRTQGKIVPLLRKHIAKDPALPQGS
jgi:hypothetical protein